MQDGAGRGDDKSLGFVTNPWVPREQPDCERDAKQQKPWCRKPECASSFIHLHEMETSIGIREIVQHNDMQSYETEAELEATDEAHGCAGTPLEVLEHLRVRVKGMRHGLSGAAFAGVNCLRQADER